MQGRLGVHDLGKASGIVDASAAFGPGAFLVTVQAHTLWVEKAPGAEDNASGVGVLLAVAEAYLARQGARKDDPESFCRIGKAEIAAGSVTGSLLVSK